MDYYNILGVNRSASPEEIKKAYRKKVKQHHPDTGGDAEQFKRINEAYEILSNSDKRSAYDNPQPEFHFNTQNMNRGNPFGQSPFEDLFGNFNRRRQPKNRDITIRADIYLEDVLNGKDLIAGYRMSSGEETTVTINVPQGARHGDQIKYEGLGDNADRRFPRGDLYVKIFVKNHPIWERDGNNLICKKRVNVFDLLLGCVILIKTLEGKQVKLNIPKGTKTTATFSIPEYGLPDLNTRRRGNLYVKIDAEVPYIEDTVLLEKIQSIRDKIYTKD